MSFSIDNPPGQPQREIFSVSRLIREVRATLEGSFPLLWLEGEISNLSRPSSGHMYFSLKDEAAQVRCAMFRGKNLHLRFKPGNGLKVLVRAKVSLYEARGDFQLIVEHMEEAGLGALQRAFDELKSKLGREGLFDQDHKQPLPTMPRRIGIITSPTGAAVRDIINVLGRRFPAVPLLIYPVPVQGEGAAKEIAETIALAGRRNECDVLILARGGGSLEDLWAFNEEILARAVHACPLPLISAVGHEVDFTIADFVADMRAPTPSAAAELVSPDRQELGGRISQLFGRIRQQHLNLHRHGQQQLIWLNKRLEQQHPGRQLQGRSQQLDELEQRLGSALQIRLERDRSRLATATAKLKQHTPKHRLQALEQQRSHLTARLQRALHHRLAEKQRQLAGLGRALDTVSPLATLQRGYAIVQQVPGTQIVRDAAQLKSGDKIETRLAHGSLLCTVDKIIETGEKQPHEE